MPPPQAGPPGVALFDWPNEGKELQVAVSGGCDFSIAVIRNDQLSGGETLACLNDLTACRLENMRGADTERSDSEDATRLARAAASSLDNACAALGRSRSELLHARPSPPRTLWFVSLNTLSAIVARGGGGYPGFTSRGCTAAHTELLQSSKTT